MKTFWMATDARRDGSGDSFESRWFDSYADAREAAEGIIRGMSDYDIKDRSIAVCGYNSDCESVAEWEDWLDEQVCHPDPDEWEDVFIRVAYIEQTAASLYDGGWRASDREQLAHEFHLHPDDLSEICGFLETFEEADNAEELED